MLAEKGHTCIEVDFGLPGESEKRSSSQNLVDRLSEGMFLFIWGVHITFCRLQSSKSTCAFPVVPFHP